MITNIIMDFNVQVANQVGWRMTTGVIGLAIFVDRGEKQRYGVHK